MRPHWQQPTSLPRPWDSPSKNTGVGCHFPLIWILHVTLEVMRKQGKVMSVVCYFEMAQKRNLSCQTQLKSMKGSLFSKEMVEMEEEGKLLTMSLLYTHPAFLSWGRLSEAQAALVEGSSNHNPRGMFSVTSDWGCHHHGRSPQVLLEMYPEIPVTSHEHFSLFGAGGKGAGHNLWKNDIAQGGNISWLESDGSKMAVKSTLTRTWSSVYTHRNTLES